MKSQDTEKPDEAVAALNFFTEVGLLKHIRRSGWWVVGIKNPESVAEHSFRCSVIAFYLACEENADPTKASTMASFNDLHEARINDLHKMGHFYIDFREAEHKVFVDQMSKLPVKVRQHFETLRDEYCQQKTSESIVARDADILECLVQAKEYLDQGFLQAEHFFREAPSHLKTVTAKKWWESLQQWDSAQWWQKVVCFER